MALLLENSKVMRFVSGYFFWITSRASRQNLAMSVGALTTTLDPDTFLIFGAFLGTVALAGAAGAVVAGAALASFLASTIVSLFHICLIFWWKNLVLLNSMHLDQSLGFPVTLPAIPLEHPHSSMISKTTHARRLSTLAELTMDILDGFAGSQS
jgi:hypothetical protein